MLIARLMTVWLVPFGFLFSHLNYLPISLFESITGAVFGYSILWFLKTIFFYIHQKEGMGQGDLEIMAMIGAFTGPFGSWIVLTIGSLLGSCVGLFLLIFKKKDKLSLKLPFGAFLALGAILYIIFSEKTINLLLNF